MSDHIVYLDAGAKELEKILEGSKKMILRGATGRKIPYGRVFKDDTLYFIRNNGEGHVQASARVLEVFNSPKLSPDESSEFITSRIEKLQLTPKQILRWKGKRYLVAIEITDVEQFNPFRIDKSEFRNMDDWLPVESISKYKVDDND